MAIDKKILKQLKENDSALTDLRLDNKNINNDDLRELSAALQGNTTLKTLGLRSINMDDEGAKILSTALATNTGLERLGLEFNDFGPVGMGYLSNALMGNNSLKALGLNECPIGDQGAAYLSEMLKKNESLSFLYIVNCGIGDKGAQDLGDALPWHPNLKELEFQGNDIGVNGELALICGSDAHHQSQDWSNGAPQVLRLLFNKGDTDKLIAHIHNNPGPYITWAVLEKLGYSDFDTLLLHSASIETNQGSSVKNARGDETDYYQPQSNAQLLSQPRFSTVTATTTTTTTRSPDQLDGVSDVDKEVVPKSHQSCPGF